MGRRARCVLLVMLLVQQAGELRAQDGAPVQTTAVSDETLLFADVPVVQGASKYEQKVSEAPSAVSIVTASDIRKYGYRTLADLLRGVRGFYVTYDRNYSYVGVRGFGRPVDYNTRVLLLVDGHRMNDNIYDGAYFGTDAVVDIDLVDRVEIIRGPGSSLYGSNAFFAVINVVMKRGRDLKGGENSGEAASGRAYKVRATYGSRKADGVEALVSGSAYDSTGRRHFYPEYDAPATNNGIADHTDYERSQSFFAKLSHRDLTLTGAHLSRTKGIPTGSFFTDFNDPRSRTRDERGYADLMYERTLGGAEVEARVSYDRYRYVGEYAYFTDPLVSALNKDIGMGDWWSGELKLSRRLREVHRVIAGAEYRASLREVQENYDADPYRSVMPRDDRRSRVAAVYLQDEIALGQRLLLNAGVRHDDYYTFGGTTNPRAALIYNAADRSTVKLLYGSAFRAPNAFELYWRSNTTIANPDLRPEKIRTAEIVYEKSLLTAAHASVSGYFYRIDDLITQVTTTTIPADITQFRNMDDVTARGVELEADNRWRNGIEGRISYTLQRAEDKVTGRPLTNSPARMTKLNVMVPLFGDRVSAGIEEQYLSRRRTEQGRYAAAFGVTNMTFTAQTVLRRLEASASVYNLFDRRFGDPVSGDFLQDTILQDGRTWRAKLTYVF